ncbi:MAG TPA: hypothetical protein VH083_28675 [Myxococcales bacterium]|jgi:hypothetical protein|nr:hypothetical protein [Myxococcales bacterium]
MMAKSPRKASRWWWLLPPVKAVLDRMHLDRLRRQVLAELPLDDYEALLNFSNKATGWFLVAGGGFLLAVNETKELTDRYRLGTIGFIAACAVPAVASVLDTTVRLYASRRLLKTAAPREG